jgi:hypothetical protein
VKAPVSGTTTTFQPSWQWGPGRRVNIVHFHICTVVSYKEPHTSQIFSNSVVMTDIMKAYADGVRFAAFNRSSLDPSSPLLVVCNDKGLPPDPDVYPKTQSAFVTLPGKFSSAMNAIYEQQYYDIAMKCTDFINAQILTSTSCCFNMDLQCKNCNHTKRSLRH